MNVKARLIEPGTAYFIGNVLKNCGMYRKKMFNYSFNIILSFIFVITIFCILYFAKTNKNEKLKNKERDDYQKQVFMLDTIKKIKQLKEKSHNEMASNIPFESSLHHQDKIFI